MSTIRYFLPEDGDVESTPNVFLAPKPSRPGYPPLLGQIKSSFPLPGSYHFRFKTALIPGTDRDKNCVTVWMDCVEDSEPVRVWQGAIMAKVTRIGMDGDDEDDEFDEDFAGAGVSRAESNMSSVSAQSQPRAVPETASMQSMQSSESLLGGAFDDPPAPAPAAPAASAASSAHSSTGNLLDVDHHPPAPASGGSLLDMDHLGTGAGYPSSGSGANTPTLEHNDLLNMSAPMPAAHAQPHAPHPGHPGAAPHAPVPQRPPQQMPMQQRPPQQAPMQGQYPMQYPPQGGQYPQQGMAQMHAPQQQQQQRNSQNGGNNAFDKFSDPLGNLNWS